MSDEETSASRPVGPNVSPELQGLDPAELLARGMQTVQPSGSPGKWQPPQPEELGRLLPQYRIDGLIGCGGMGAVYRAVQLSLDRVVAIKLLPVEIATDTQFTARFEREAHTLARLQHARIVTIYESGRTSAGQLYFVMEYVDGTNLRAILRGPGLEPQQALVVVTQLCEALQAAHREGIVHRDLKPENVLITRDGHVKLVDFGLSRPPQEEDGPALTSTNLIMGTPGYMAPEQHVAAAKADHRTDIYALGVMFYEMLTGQVPRGAFALPSRKVQVDVRIDEVVIKALQAEPDLRYQQASEMRSEVEHIRKTPPPAAPAPTVPLPPRPPKPAPRQTTQPRAMTWFVVVGVVVLAGVLGLGAFAFLGQGRHSVSSPATPAPPIPAEVAALPTTPVPVKTRVIATPPPMVSNPPPKPGVDLSVSEVRPAMPAALVLPPDSHGIEERTIFNGRDLTDWSGRPEVWSVEEGAITGQSSATVQPERPSSIVWRGGNVADFELTLKMRMQLGDGDRMRPSDPSRRATRSFGIQFRGTAPAAGNFNVKGYVTPSEPEFGFTGQLLEYGGRDLTNTPRCGESYVLTDSGNPHQPKFETTGRFGDYRELGATLRKDDWNEVKVVAVGNHIQISWNGRLFTDILDRTEAAAGTGALAFAFLTNHDNIVSKVQFKDIKLRQARASASPSANPVSPAPTAPVAVTPPSAPTENGAQQAFERVLISNVWSWTPAMSNAREGELVLHPDGTAVCVGTNARWKVTGPRSVAIAFPTATVTLNFDETGRRFTGTPEGQRGAVLTGAWKRPMAAAVAQSVATPTPAPVVVAPPLPATPTPTPKDGVFYTTGFESPGYPLGKFHREGFSSVDSHWGLFANGNGSDIDHAVTITGKKFKEGTQALEVYAAPAKAIQSGVSAKIENAGNKVIIAADLYLESASKQTHWQFAVGDEQAAKQGGFVAGFNVSGDDGHLQIMTKDFPDNRTIVARNTWTQVELRLDLKAQNYDIVFNGAPVATQVPLLVRTSRVRLFQFDTFAKGNDRAYLDNFSFAATK